MIKKIIITISLFVIIITFVISYLSLTRTTVIASDLYLSLLLEAQRQSEQLDSGINYPPTIDTDREKLEAVYSLIEQMRKEHNRQLSIYEKSNGTITELQWRKYIKIFRSKNHPLLEEQNRLKMNIRKASYSDIEWETLNIIGNEDVLDSVIETIFGNKTVEKEKPTLATSDRLDELKAINLAEIEESSLFDPYEDFTEYTEEDAENVYTVTSTKITIDAGTEDLRNNFVYYDYGVDHFDDFEHLYEMYLTAVDSGHYLFLWAVGNTVEDWPCDDHNSIEFGNSSGTYKIRAREYVSNSQQNYESWSCSASILYFITTEKNGTSMTHEIRTGSHIGTLEDTLSYTCNTQAHRYLYGTQGFSATDNANGYIQNLDIKEAVPDIYISPTSRNLGIVLQNGTYWTNTANSTPPSWPLTDGDAYFTVTNNGSMAVDITIKGTNFTGGSSNWTLVHTSPGSNEARWSAWYESGNLTDNTTFTTTEQNFISSLAASADIDIELRLETGTFDLTEGGTKTCTLTLTAGAS